jgi:3-oxoacyl-[acyl-carrier protein] reductase
MASNRSGTSMSSDTLLQHKNAVIYGGGGAIGAAVARAFARDGAHVFLAGRTLERAHPTSRDLARADCDAPSVPSSSGHGQT